MNEMIEWMDLGRQFEEHEDEFMEAVKQVCSKTAFSGGKFAEKFEKEFADFCKVSGAAGVNSGTSALFLGMKALEIGEGDEVIVPADTFIATAWGVSHNGATPVFVDIDEDTFNISADCIERAVNERTRAIAGVHLYGQPFDYDAVRKIADKYNLYVIEDCAQAHGATYKTKPVGGLGDIGCFSFYPGKNLGAFGEAGAVTSDNAEIIEQINVLKNHGCQERYYHDCIGYNMRMEGIQGAILSVKLKYLAEWTKRRQQIARRYLSEINNSKIKLQRQPEWAESVFHLFVVQVDNRDRFTEHMAENKIRLGLHYPVPCHLQKAYSSLGYREGDLPVSEYHAEHCVSLPMFPELTDKEVSRVIEACNNYH